MAKSNGTRMEPGAFRVAVSRAIDRMYGLDVLQKHKAVISLERLQAELLDPKFFRASSKSPSGKRTARRGPKPHSVSATIRELAAVVSPKLRTNYITPKSAYLARLPEELSQNRLYGNRKKKAARLSQSQPKDAA